VVRGGVRSTTFMGRRNLPFGALLRAISPNYGQNAPMVAGWQLQTALFDVMG
jgi:hypothetical protein